MVRASAMLRLYTALRGIAGLKLSEDEVACLLEMIIRKPPLTPKEVYKWSFPVDRPLQLLTISDWQ